jgi:hypothetical protein
MLRSIKQHVRQCALAIWAALLALLAVFVGCDKKVEWRGVGTDGNDSGRSADPPSTGGDIRDVKSE